MSVLRVFLAVDIPSEIQQAISTQTASLRREAGQVVRWVAAENIHLTLKFFGDIPGASLGPLTQNIQSECAHAAPFTVSLGGLGCFPNHRRPRVIWIGLEAPPDLGQLQRRIETGLARLGYSPEPRPYSPHLTLGRVRERSSPAELHTLGSLLERTTLAGLGAFTVDEIHLYRSDLRPGGPVYSRLAGASLTG